MGSSADSKSRLRARSAASLLLALAVSGLGLVSSEGLAAGRGRRASRAEPFQLATAPLEGRYLSLGLNLGLGGDESADQHEILPQGDTYPVVGLEASMVKLRGRDFVWLGGYADLVQSLPNRATRISLGPEVGWGPLGLDLGLLGELRRGQLGGGFQVRGLLTLAYVTAYASFHAVYERGERRLRENAQVGLLLKLPFVMELTGNDGTPSRRR